MSSILKALKKAEQDGSLYRNNPDLKLNVQRIFNANAWVYKGKNSSNIQKTLLILCILIIAGLSGFLFLSQHKKSQEDRLPGSAYAPPSVYENIEPSANQSPASENKKKETSESASMPLPEKTTLMQTPSSVPSRSQEKNSSQAESAQENLAATDAIEEISGDSLKIQAISWAEAPENRIAVINNNIVSENDFIQDYRIITIDKDEILLEKSSRKFRLRFRYR